jgi:DNA-binding transcriptional MocR family regulator
MKQALAWLSESLPASSALSFRPNVVLPRHRAVAVNWLELCGLEVSPQNISITNGASSGMTVALMCVAPPGSTVAAEAIGHHTLIPLARYLGFNLEGLPTDREGLIPEALDQACRRGKIDAAFLQPSVINPHATLMGEERRRQIAEIARRHDIALIENDVLGPLIETRAPPLARFAPERTLYVTSFTKITLPGLRIGYLALPDRYVAAAANRHLVTNWMATPILAEIASRWVTDGTAMELVRWQRNVLERRQQVAAEIFAEIDIHAHPQALHVWIELPPDRKEESFVAQARLQGVAIAPGTSFRIAPDMDRPAVRISLGSTTEEDLRVGLGIVYKLLQGTPEHLLLAI